jgi:carboxyl-terminal processing protease
MLGRRGAFFAFGQYYLGVHKTIPRDFEVNQDVIEEFKTFLAKEKIQLSDQDLQANLDFIKDRIGLQLVTVIFGESEAAKISLAQDPLIQKALEALPQAKELLTKAKKYMASKAQR